MNTRRRFPGSRMGGNLGFSLAEVAISVGIIVVAIIPLVSLLPVGFSNYRSAADSLTRTAIVHQVTSIVASQPTAVPDTLYFSAEIARLESAQDAAYRVNLSLTSNDAIPSALDNGRTPVARLVRVTCEIFDLRSDRKLGTDAFQLALRE